MCVPPWTFIVDRMQQQLDGLASEDGAQLRPEVQFSPAVCMEMSWRWAEELLGGEYKVQCYLQGTLDEPGVAAIRQVRVAELLRQLLPIFAMMFDVAGGRRKRGNQHSKAELLAIIDYLVCGFLSVTDRDGVNDPSLVNDIRALLARFKGLEDRHLSDAAIHLDRQLPLIVEQGGLDGPGLVELDRILSAR